MTRINAHIPVTFLCDEHLKAEHREIKRVCNRYMQRLSKNKFDDIPSTFRLGTGHELFFINKPTYTLLRFKEIHQECINRGFNMTDFSDNWDVYEKKDSHLFVDYPYSETDNKLIIERITERLLSMKNIHYNRKKTTAEKMIELINGQ